MNDNVDKRFSFHRFFATDLAHVQFLFKEYHPTPWFWHFHLTWHFSDQFHLIWEVSESPHHVILTLPSDPNLLSNANQFVKAFSVWSIRQDLSFRKLWYGYSPFIIIFGQTFIQSCTAKATNLASAVSDFWESTCDILNTIFVFSCMAQ